MQKQRRNGQTYLQRPGTISKPQDSITHLIARMIHSSQSYTIDYGRLFRSVLMGITQV